MPMAFSPKLWEWPLLKPQILIDHSFGVKIIINVVLFILILKAGRFVGREKHETVASVTFPRKIVALRRLFQSRIRSNGFRIR